MLYFVIYGGKIGYVFVIGGGFFVFGTMLDNNSLLSGEVNS